MDNPYNAQTPSLTPGNAPSKFYLAIDTLANINANYPAANYPGLFAYATDIGPNGAAIRSNGTYYALASGSAVVLRSSAAYGMAPTFTINAGSSGTFTSGTAFYRTFSEGIFMYFPANATVTPNLSAQLYWVVMSSTTVGTIYDTQWAGGSANSGIGTPTIGNPITFTVGAAGVAGATNVGVRCLLQAIPAGIFTNGANMLCRGNFSLTNSANTKTANVNFGGQIQLTNSLTNSTYFAAMGKFWSTGASSQTSQGLWASGNTTSPNTTTAINSAVSNNMVVTINRQIATEVSIMESFSATLELP